MQVYLVLLVAICSPGWSSEQPNALHEMNTTHAMTPARHRVTVASGFWSLDRNKYGGSAKYRAWFQNSLQIDAPYVMFYGDESDLAMLTEARAAFASITRFVPMPLAALDSAFQKATGSGGGGSSLEQHFSRTLPYPLRLIWFSKMHLLKFAVKLNVFGTNWFSWIDAGVNVYRDQPPPAGVWPAPQISLADLPTDRLIHSVPSKAIWASCFSGSAFMIHASAVSSMAALFYSLYKQECVSASYCPCLSVSKICAAKRQRSCSDQCKDDQAIFHLMRSRYPDLFSIIQPSSAKAGPGKCGLSCGWACSVTGLYSDTQNRSVAVVNVSKSTIILPIFLET